ncbi:MAG: alpha/beta hydrolase [Deltaproteobacteria bacterium]|nr:alpha/beta hydrolase [Deltaproteobacteria bacterium]
MRGANQCLSASANEESAERSGLEHMAIKKVIIRLLRILALLLGVFVLSFLSGCWNWFVEKQVFFPDTTIEQTPADLDLPFEDIWFTSSDSVRLHGWLIPASPSSYILLFCHGNAGNISHRLDNVRLLNQRGISVFIFDYRGYGQSDGSISEKGFYIDSEAAYQVARKWADQHKAKLVVFGRSLGGIAATHVGATQHCNGLILESTFTNMGAMAGAHYPLPFAERLLKHRLNAVGEIGGVQVPVLFFHGDNDKIVPIRLGRALYDAAPNPKEFVVIPGAGHNDTYFVGGQNYFRKIADFLNSL